MIRQCDSAISEIHECVDVKRLVDVLQRGYRELSLDAGNDILHEGHYDQPFKRSFCCDLPAFLEAA